MKTFKQILIQSSVTIASFVVTLAIIFSFTACSSWNRAVVDMQSDFGGGLNRTINVYTANGDLLATYTGKIDIEETEGGYVKFDFDGKRYIYYNCFVETIADIN